MFYLEKLSSRTEQKKNKNYTHTQFAKTYRSVSRIFLQRKNSLNYLAIIVGFDGALPLWPINEAVQRWQGVTNYHAPSTRTRPLVSVT